MADINNLSEDNIKEMIALLNSMLESKSQNKSLDTKTESYKKPSSNPVKTKSRRRNTKTQEPTNLFDQMQEKTMHKDDAKIDKLLSCIPPGPRTRKFSLINVSCRVCGKKETISPALLHDSIDRYKCNKCCGGPG